jgi:hypothetical protein
MDAADEAPEWRTSSYSSGGACVEIAPQRDTILVRDSKDREGAILTFGRESFAAFIAAVADGDFDRR